MTVAIATGGLCKRCGRRPATATAGPYVGLCDTDECRRDTREKKKAAHRAAHSAAAVREGRAAPAGAIPPLGPPDVRWDDLDDASPRLVNDLDVRFALLRELRRQVDDAARHARELAARAEEARTDAARLTRSYRDELRKIGL